MNHILRVCFSARMVGRLISVFLTRQGANALLMTFSGYWPLFSFFLRSAFYRTYGIDLRFGKHLAIYKLMCSSNLTGDLIFLLKHLT